MVLISPISQHFRAIANGFINVYRNGLLYCERPFLNGQLFYINLPFDGSYSFSGNGFVFMQQTELIKNQQRFNLPKPERTKYFGVNKILVDTLSTSPARIATDKNIIILNPKFFDFSVEVKLFILLHEVGHFYYKTEWKCDQYAAYHFLEMGCNPSQAFESLAGVICEHRPDGTPNEINQDRIKKIYNLLAA